MDINNASGKGGEHRIFEHAHVSGENDEIDFGVTQFGRQLLFALGRESRLKVPFFNGSRLQAGSVCQLQNARVGHIGADHGDASVQPSILNRMEDGTEVRALSRTEDAKTKRIHWKASNHLPARATSQAVLPNIYFPCKMRLAGEQ